MKKAIISSLILSLIPGFCLGVNDRIYKLMQEKQAKMEKLEKCQGTTKNLKIAGLSTLGITAVGVGANIAEAVVLNDYKSDVAKAKDARDAQQKIKDDRLAKLAKEQEADIIQNRETEKEVESESVEAPKTKIKNNDVSDVFDTEQACKESCKTSTGCFPLTATNKWTCVSDLSNNVSITKYRAFVNVLDCMKYCAEDCEMVNTSLYRCYKSKAQAEKEKPVDKEDALVPGLLKDLEQEGKDFSRDCNNVGGTLTGSACRVTSVQKTESSTQMQTFLDQDAKVWTDKGFDCKKVMSGKNAHNECNKSGFTVYTQDVEINY